jgi:hypothetical protein
MSTTAKRAKPPKDAVTLDAVCELPRDHVEYGDFWFMTDGYTITLAQQKTGEAAKSATSVPKTVFDRFVRWYLTGDTDMRKGGNL